MVFFDGCGAGIVGGEGQNDLIGLVFVFGQKIPEVTCPGIGVFVRFMGVCPQFPGRIRHQLHRADCALGRKGGRIQIRFRAHHPGDECGGQRVLLGGVSGPGPAGVAGAATERRNVRGRSGVRG